MQGHMSGPVQSEVSMRVIVPAVGIVAAAGAIDPHIDRRSSRAACPFCIVFEVLLPRVVA